MNRRGFLSRSLGTAVVAPMVIASANNKPDPKPEPMWITADYETIKEAWDRENAKPLAILRYRP